MSLVTKAIAAASTATTVASNVYVSTVFVNNIIYTVPTGHYAIIKAIVAGQINTVYNFWINSSQFNLNQQNIVPSGGLRIAAGTTVRTSIAEYSYFLLEVYTV